MSVRDNIYIYAECDSSGNFKGLIQMYEHQIITMGTEEGPNGEIYLEYVEDGEEHNTFFLEYKVI